LRLKNKTVLQLLLAISLTSSYTITNHNLLIALELAALLPEKENNFDDFFNEIYTKTNNIKKDLESEYDKLAQDFESTKPKDLPAQKPNLQPTPKGKLPPPPLPTKNYKPKAESTDASEHQQTPMPKQNQNNNSTNDMFEQLKNAKAKRSLDPDMKKYNELKSMGYLNAAQKEELDALKAKLFPEQSSNITPKGKSTSQNNLDKVLENRRKGIDGEMDDDDNEPAANEPKTKPKGKYPSKKTESEDDWD